MRTVVGVLRGGPSSEYEVSLKSGATVLAELDKNKYDARDIFIDRTGTWHNHGLGGTPEKVLSGVDVVFNTIHGQYGEDGQLHSVLDPLGIPYTGASKIPSILAFNKNSTRDVVSKLGIKVAHGIVVEPNGEYETLARDLFRTFPHPAVVKPTTGGSSVGVSIVRTYHDLAPALERAADISPQVLLEEFIQGKEATVGVIDNFRNESAYALVPVPSTFTHQEKSQLVSLAKQIHGQLGLSHFSQSDFIVSRRGIYFLEINALPKLHKGSLFIQALETVGSKLSDFLDHVIQLAKGRQ